MPLVELAVDGVADAEEAPRLGPSLRRLHAEEAACDVVLVCSGARFPVHRVALAAASRVWRERLLSVQDLEVPVAEVSLPEAVRFMIRFIYGVDALGAAFDPGTPEVNRAVLVLARCFELPQLTDLAMYWLAKDITTANVVETLRTCREFQLDALHARIIEELIADRAALTEVSRSTQIARYPELMQALLQQAAAAASREAQAIYCQPVPAQKEYGNLHVESVNQAVLLPCPAVPRRRSVGKQREEAVTAEIAAGETRACAEAAPKKRQKIAPGR